MLKPIAILTFAALLASTALYAQETTPPPANEEPAAEAPAALPEVDMGTPVTEEAADPAAPTVGQTYVREEFGDWLLRCLKTEDGNDPCQLYQLLKDADDNAVAEISIRSLPAGGEAEAGATIVAPLETLLLEPLVLSVDNGTPRRYPFRFCNRAGCVAQVGFTADEIAQFKRGAAGKLTLVPAGAPETKVELVISLNGFTAGYEAITPAQ